MARGKDAGDPPPGPHAIRGSRGEPPPPRCFDIGLALAGAVSAGAYTAGVMDFLIQALEAWESAKAAERERHGDDFRRWEVPPHDVRLRVMCGASAGAITAAIAAVALVEDFAPVTEVPPSGAARANKFYRSWVEEADIGPMLALADLKGGRAVTSLLNAAALDPIARAATDFDWRGRWRPYVADRLDLFLTVTNLRGVPYGIELHGVTPAEHQMSAHADHMAFTLMRPGASQARDDRFSRGVALRPDRPTDSGWEKLAQAALASSAFPVGLAPRALSRPAGDYNRRPWIIPRDRPEKGLCADETPIRPGWSLGDDNPYGFLTVDGGAINNEPLELARRVLAGRRGRNPRGASEADSAVIMIDPFPNAVPFDPDYQAKADVVSVLKATASTLLAQARFKADELKLAQRRDVFSRFVIAPIRYREQDGGTTPEAFALASGGLGGFGGFLNVGFRAHDFQLGRRNCQRFLRKHFILAADNPRFADWPDALKKKKEYLVRRSAGDFLPIIPLVGDAAKTVPQPAWPHLPADEVERLRTLVRGRTKAVGGRLIDQYGGGWVGRLGWWAFRRRVVRKIMDWVESDLAARGQYVRSAPSGPESEFPIADS